METNDHKAYLVELRETLTGDKLSVIDFDGLISRLGQIGEALDLAAIDREELSMLRNDYQSRIGGMLKAVAAVDRKGNGLHSALSTVEALPGMTVSQLIECYRRSSARFRDSFPTSFGLLSSDPTIPGQSKQFGDFK